MSSFMKAADVSDEMRIQRNENTSFGERVYSDQRQFMCVLGARGGGGRGGTSLNERIISL